MLRAGVCPPPPPPPPTQNTPPPKNKKLGRNEKPDKAETKKEMYETPIFNPLKTKRRLLYLTLRLLMSYIYGAPSKARNANVVYIWTYVWQR